MVTFIEDLDEQIAATQQSTRTFVPWLAPVHHRLRHKYPWYYRWHIKWWSKHVHFAGLVIGLLILEAAVLAALVG